MAEGAEQSVKSVMVSMDPTMAKGGDARHQRRDSVLTTPRSCPLNDSVAVRVDIEQAVQPGRWVGERARGARSPEWGSETSTTQRAMSARRMCERILRNELPDGISLSKEKAMASVNHFVRVFNKFLAEGLSLEAVEVNLTEAIRKEVVAQGFWDNAEDEDKGVAPEPAALTDAVVKRTFMDEFSYSCDRVRCLLWHSEEDTPWNACLHGPASEKATDVGDVIGCMLDLDRGEIRFSIDGLVVEEPEFPEISLASGYFPALTMSVGEVEFNFGEEGFSCLPEGYSAITCYLTEQDHARAMDVAAAKNKLEQEKNEKLLKKRERLAAKLERERMRLARMDELKNILKNPDLSGALAVLEILDKAVNRRGRAKGKTKRSPPPRSPSRRCA